MYTYRNRKTGDVICVPCELNGPDFEALTEKQEAKPKKTVKKKAEKEPEEK